MPVSRLFPWRIVWGRPTYLPASALRYWTTESGSENQQTCMHTDTKKLLRICHIRPSDLNIETRPFVKYMSVRILIQTRAMQFMPTRRRRGRLPTGTGCVAGGRGRFTGTGADFLSAHNNASNA